MTKIASTPEKSRLHPRNINRDPYDLAALLKIEPTLVNHLKPTKYGSESIDFSDAKAVKLLNKALLNYYYNIAYWDFPPQHLCPPIPGRADYLHYLADLLADCNGGNIPKGNSIKGLDIGVGASCIYPILGSIIYGWKFIGSDINPQSIASSKNIIMANTALQKNIECRLQSNPKAFFKGILQTNERVDFTLCNPPFHASAEEAQKGTLRKVRNLTRSKVKQAELNFAGTSNELIYEGGEVAFIKQMIDESRHFAKQCFWFTTLVAKEAHLQDIYKVLKKVAVHQTKTIAMGTGNKTTRIVAWSYLDATEQEDWKKKHWQK